MDNNQVDLFSYLYSLYKESRNLETTIEFPIIEDFITFSREYLNCNPPVTTSITDQGMAIRFKNNRIVPLNGESKTFIDDFQAPPSSGETVNAGAVHVIGYDRR